MKKILLLLLIVLIPGMSLFAETTKTITVENNLDSTIYYLYLSPADEREWGVDRLGDDLFDISASIDINVTYDESLPLYDLMAEDEMENTYRIENIDLSRISSISISEDDYIPFGGRNPIYRDFTFSNDTGEDIYYLYISSRDSMYWGEDLLGDDIFEAGTEVVLNLPIDEEYPDNDILAEGASGSSYELMDYNMMENDYFSISESDMSQSGEDYYDDYDYDDFSMESDDYLEGYKDGFRDAWKEAYSQGFQAAMEQSY